MNRAVAFLVSLACISSSVAVGAQSPDTVGVRAQGMGGAFTAIADDATATWWNPAGLAAGAFFNLILETSSQHEPADDTNVPAWRGTSRGFAVAYPALGLSYYRLRVSEIQPAASTATDAAGRQDTGAGKVRLRSLILNQFGATVGQSIGNHLVVASTVKLVRAGAAIDIRERNAASLETAEDLGPAAEGHAGLDVGAMARFGGVTLGLMVRNATEPTYGGGDNTFKLARHARLGISVRPVGGTGIGGLIVGADLDLTRTAAALGDERRFAAGAELWTPARRIGVRAGISGNTLGSARPAASGGISVAVRSGTYLDGQVTGGADDARRGWGSALRVTF